MRKLPVILFAIAIPLTSLRAQDPEPKSKRATPPPPKARVVAPPGAAATPAPRRSVVDRLFGIRPTPTPQPAPEEESTSKPKYRPKRRPAPAPEPESVPVRKAEPAVKEAASAEEDATKPVDVAPSTEPAPVKPGKGSRKPAPAKPNLAGLDDAAKFKAVKSTALEDAEIKALKIKAETTVDEAEAHTASVEYNKALFRKIRSIEPSLGNYVETVEQAMMKRLSSEKSAQ